MAKNDKVLLDGIIDERIEKKFPSEDRGEVFEFLVLEQVVKEYDLSGDEINSGWIDGRQDGGIDGFYIFVNGHYLNDVESFQWPKSGSELNIYLITCKHNDGFKQAVLDNLAASLTEFVNFGIPESELKGAYSEEVKICRKNLEYTYRKLASKISKFKFEIIYSSRGNSEEIGDEVRARSAQIQNIIQESFGACDSRFSFWGSAELVSMHRRIPSYSLELPFKECLWSGERYVLLAGLSEYYAFISGGEEKLKRYLFDSNVRDFMGLNRVNEDIKKTLETEASPDFWWLNNGITMLASSAKVIGKSIVAEDIQIVNGLQTTESIYRYFKDGGKDKRNRSVLIKIIVSNESDVRDEIIRATNNQTNVEISSLHSTDKVQRDIEEILHRENIFYERRKNYYKNQDKSPQDIVTPQYLAAGFVGLFLKQPHKAAGLRTRFMGVPEAYELVFSESHPIEIWPKIAKVLKLTDDVLEPKDLQLFPGPNEGYLKNRRYLLSFLCTSKILSNFNFSYDDFIKLDLNKYNKDEMVEMSKLVEDCAKVPRSNKKWWRNKSNIMQVCARAATKWNIPGLEQAAKRNDYPILDEKLGVKRSRPLSMEITMDFALKAKELLPPQPWKPGIHKRICESLKCSFMDLNEAIEILIDEGHIGRQRDGVVYDDTGNVIAFDPERVDPDTMKLRKEAMD